MLNTSDARRRWFGTFFLILAAGSLAWGLTFLAPVLSRNPVLFIIYWLTCFGLTILSFGIALCDLRAVRRRLRDEQRTAFNKAFGDFMEKDKRK